MKRSTRFLKGATRALGEASERAAASTGAALPFQRTKLGRGQILVAYLPLTGEVIEPFRVCVYLPLYWSDYVLIQRLTEADSSSLSMH